MSENTAPAWRDRATAQSHPTPITPTRPRLQVIERESAPGKSSLPLVLAALALLFFAVVVPMITNTQMAQRAYDIRDQKIALSELQATKDSLESQLIDLRSPQALEAGAQELGMVPSGPVGVISLEKQSIVGGAAAQ